MILIFHDKNWDVFSFLSFWAFFEFELAFYIYLFIYLHHPLFENLVLHTNGYKKGELIHMM